jgi:exopolyphosphatase / guanosine-5'-triphosphate,3'-diphosphate pyrophosphatase
VRVAVVDVGTNSTRLLIADVRDGAVTELDRRSVVTRLGEGVDDSGRLALRAQLRVLHVLGEYVKAIERQDCERRVAVSTSAVRDAENGAQFARRVARITGLDPRMLSGAEAARLTFLGASTGRAGDDLLVIDVGGGSTELVKGPHEHVSTQNGVVRHSERHLHDDPPPADQLQALATDVRENLKGTVPEAWKAAGRAGSGAAPDLKGTVPFRLGTAVAVAGTATQCAAMDLELERYDAARVEGHVLTADALRGLLERTASVPLARRREIRGLDPDRAPVIVAGIAILLEVLDFFGLDRVEASEHDILWGVALEAENVR